VVKVNQINDDKMQLKIYLTREAIHSVYYLVIKKLKDK